MIKNKYNCENGGKEFSQKSNYNSHKNRKTPCNKKEEKKIIKYIDVFCGMGSFHYSFQKLGLKCVLACDIYQPAKDNYKLNYGIEPLGDICDINPKDIENYDSLCAGFPCQPFSWT